MQSPARFPAAGLVGKTRYFLLLGFGSLLALMGFGVVEMERLLERIRTRSSSTQQQFVERSRTLNDIRSALYLSGTFFRDYVLDTDTARSNAQLQRLEQLRRAMDGQLTGYQRILPDAERPTFNRLTAELDAYWNVLNPALSWDDARRAAEGYAFLRDRVYPRRSAVIDLADEVARLNEQQVLSGEAQVAALFAEFRQQVRWTLLGAIGLGLLLAVLTGRQILHLEREAAARYEQEQHARRELRDLSARLVEAQEDERRSISRDLHDEVGQSLSAILVEATNLAATLPEGANRHVASIQRLTEETVGVVRNMSLLLRPSMLDDLGLVPALEWQARELSRRMDLQVDIIDDGVGEGLSEQHKTCIYRVVQEALNNAARHAGAKRVRVQLSHVGKALHLRIEDDGRGFAPERQKGVGLLGIEERIATLGGTFELHSAPGAGASLRIALPLGGTQHG